MTAPVTQSGNPDDGYWVSFFMPAEHALEALPTPSNGTVEIRALEGQTFAAVRYRGGWREKLYQKHLDRLMTALAESNLETGRRAHLGALQSAHHAELSTNQ